MRKPSTTNLVLPPANSTPALYTPPPPTPLPPIVSPSPRRLSRAFSSFMNIGSPLTSLARRQMSTTSLNVSPSLCQFSLLRFSKHQTLFYNNRISFIFVNRNFRMSVRMERSVVLRRQLHVKRNVLRPSPNEEKKPNHLMSRDLVGCDTSIFSTIPSSCIKTKRTIYNPLNNVFRTVIHTIFARISNLSSIFAHHRFHCTFFVTNLFYTFSLLHEYFSTCILFFYLFFHIYFPNNLYT